MNCMPPVTMGVRRIYASLVECVPVDPWIPARLVRTDGFGICNQYSEPLRYGRTHR